jgi:uncharacterized integral membrane protein
METKTWAWLVRNVQLGVVFVAMDVRLAFLDSHFMLMLSNTEERTPTIPSHRTEEVLTMRSDARSTTVSSPAPPEIPDTLTGDVREQRPLEVPNTARAREAAAAANGTETRAARSHRKALRGRLHGYAIATVALIAVLIALAASNTAHVKVNWLIGSSHVSITWLVLATAIIAWLLGLLASARFNWLTRAPQRQR